jgi:hypothetical protein
LADCYVNADFVSLFGRDPDASRSSAKLCPGYVITLGGVPLVRKSQLIQEICLSTIFAEYNFLSQALCVQHKLHKLDSEKIASERIVSEGLKSFRRDSFRRNNFRNSRAFSEIFKHLMKIG